MYFSGISHIFCCWALLIPPQLFTAFACDSPHLVLALAVVKDRHFRVQVYLGYCSLRPATTGLSYWFLLYGLRCFGRNSVIWCLDYTSPIFQWERSQDFPFPILLLWPVAWKRGKDADLQSYFTSEAQFLFTVTSLRLWEGRELNLFSAYYFQLESRFGPF